MPTRVEKLEKRKDRVVEKATDKINRQQYGGRTFKKMNKRKRNIDKKIVKTKARVATRGVKKVEKLQERKARVANKGAAKRSKSQAKSTAKTKAAVAKGKTKKAARIDKRQINKNMRTGSAIGKRLGKISKKIVKAGGPARVIKTGKKKK